MPPKRKSGLDLPPNLYANTIRSKRSHGEAIRKALGDKPIGEITVRDIAHAWLERFAAAMYAAAAALHDAAI